MSSLVVVKLKGLLTEKWFQFLSCCVFARSPAANRVDSSDSGDSCSRASSPTSNALVLSLMAQVNALQDSNKQLYQELRETKVELETLKHSWRQLAPEYEPGMLSGML